MHAAFQTGIKATNWEVEKVLKAMMKLFHDSPARRDLYMKVTENEKFPLRYEYIFQSFLGKFFSTFTLPRNIPNRNVKTLTSYI